MISHLFSMSSVVESESFVDNATKAYFNVIDEYATKGKPMEMGHWLHMYTFDIIGELFFGRMFGFINERRDIGGYMAAVDVILPHAIRLAVLYEWMRPIINIVMYPLSANLRQAIKCFEALGVESKRYVDDRVGKKSTRPDMLSKLLKVAEEKSPDFDITDVYTEAYTAIFAGSETTATAMRSCVYHLCRNPEAKAKLVGEIDEAQRDGKLSEMVTYGEAIKLPYLSAVIKEAMRVQPSIVLTFPRHVPVGGATICGRYFPEGCRVGVNPYVLHYQTSIFGEDAEDFNPDRWFRPEASNMESYMFQFGSGSRTCIGWCPLHARAIVTEANRACTLTGKNVAMAEIFKFVPKLFREYDVRLENPDKPWKEEGSWFVKQTGVEVIFSRRNVE
jgi:cytochrome P450